MFQINSYRIIKQNAFLAFRHLSYTMNFLVVIFLQFFLLICDLWLASYIFKFITSEITNTIHEHILYKYKSFGFWLTVKSEKLIFCLQLVMNFHMLPVHQSIRQLFEQSLSNKVVVKS